MRQHNQLEGANVRDMLTDLVLPRLQPACVVVHVQRALLAGLELHFPHDLRLPRPREERLAVERAGEVGVAGLAVGKANVAPAHTVLSWPWLTA